MVLRTLIPLLLVGLVAAIPTVRAADAAPAENVKRSTPPGLGDAPPDFTLLDQNGREVTLSAEWKKQPVVLIFYRGNW